MEVLFCHDGPLYKDVDNNYYGMSFTDDIFRRYYYIAEELSVVMRVKNLNDEKKFENFSRITVSPFNVLKTPNLSSVKGQLFQRNSVKKNLYQHIQKTDFIVIRLPSIIGNLAAEIAKDLKKPYLIELVGDPWDSLWNHSIPGKIIAPVMRYKTKKNVATASHVVYVTNKYLQEKYPTNGKYISASNVILEKLDSNTLKERVTKIKNKNMSNKIILGTTAAIDVKYKGQQFIIEALGKLKKNGIDNFEYQLVGKGHSDFLENCAIKNNVQDQIKFIGLLPHNEVFNWLDSIDIYIQPSLTEGLPRGLIEAMSRGLPAFGTNVGGIPELLDSNYTYDSKKSIYNILLSFNKQTMLKQAKINYDESKKYHKDIIETKRKIFFKEFKADH